MVLRKELWEVALDRYGYVTTDDVRELGANTEELARLYRRGKLERAGHGIYRFPELPVTRFDEYMLATLWTNIPNTVLSHDTALEAYELCDINPDRIHVTVPVGARIRRAGGRRYAVHHQELAPQQIGWWEGIRAVTEFTAIEQCIESLVPVHLLIDAIDTAFRRGRLDGVQHSHLLDLMERKFGV